MEVVECGGIVRRVTLSRTVIDNTVGVKEKMIKRQVIFLDFFDNLWIILDYI